ncbi:MAG: sigma-70 family RNA polymerase sigma factor [Kofleriaceae bacterium]
MGTIASTDQDLVEASRRGELDAFGQLVARYQDVVCAVSYSSTGDRALSEDVAQETFVAAWQKLDRVHAGKLRPWLISIARNLGRKARRRTRREQPIEADEQIAAGTNPFDDLARADSERIVRDALSRLPDKYREVLVLFYRENQSVRDVAQTLGIGDDAVMQRLSRGRRYLADGVTELVEKSLRGDARPRRDLVAAVLATIAAIVIPTRVEASPVKKGSTMLKAAIAASVIVAAGTTVYLVRSKSSAPTVATTKPSPTIHYGTGAARRPALGPTSPIHVTPARSASVDDLAMLPADAEVVVGIDMARIRNSPLWAIAAAPALSHMGDMKEFQTECGFDPISSLSSVTVGLKGTGDHHDLNGSIILHGFSKTKLFPCVKKLHHPHGDDGPEITVDESGDVLFIEGNANHMAMTFIDDTTALMVFGPDATKDGIAKIAARRNEKGAQGYSEMIGEINTDDAIWFAVNDSSPVLNQINDHLAEQTAIRLHGVYASIDFADGFVLNAGARTGSPELVAKAVDEIQKKLGEHSDLTTHFQQLDINADGGDVIVSVAMDTSQMMAVASNHSGLKIE